MPKFTKGKWEVGKLLDGSKQHLIFANKDTSDERVVAVIKGCCEVIDPMQTEANAQLIAAAPEMYELLWDVYRLSTTPCLYSQAIRLLARIDGEKY